MSCPVSGQQEGTWPAAEGHRESHHDQRIEPSKASTELVEIPQPPQHLFGLLGNIPDIDPGFVFKDIWRLQKMYGPIMKLNLNGDRVFVGSQQLVNEISDPKRFEKIPGGALKEVRALAGDGLFTAYNEEPNWGKAHRMLIPTFGPIGIRKMWDGMQDIASQMILKWDRLGPNHEIDCSDDLTRLAFDTIGLCAFSYRFNQFYSESVHPFATQMSDVLLESGKKSARPQIVQALYQSAESQRQANVASMHELCDEIVADRKKHPQPDNRDLLNVMLNSTDRETGEGLSDENIRFQLVTFLVAGHETTSATLSFCYYNLLKHPEVLLKAQKIVDEVVGDDVVSPEHVPKLEYIDACIKETLRLSSPIPGTGLTSRTDQILGGKYFLPAYTPVIINNTALHHDPLVWGNDAELYRPERWLDGGYSKLPPNSWKPFGTGVRACIGRAFAEQEMIMNVAMVLQRFQLELADPSYEMQLKSTLTIKPTEFRMKARRRTSKAAYVGIPGSVRKTDEATKPKLTAKSAVAEHKKPLAIYFGGNSGTCEALAQGLETTAQDYGFDVSISALDSATEHVPKDKPVIFISSSYEGQPPDNAKKFVSWLEGLGQDTQSLSGAKYAVFGVGNSDWASTFHRIPTLVDDLLEKSGATRLLPAGFTNVKTDLIGPWDEWSAKILEVLTAGDAETAKPKSTLKVSVQRKSPDAQRDADLKFGTVLVNKELAGTEIGPAKRHLEIQLPAGTPYTAGDYLVVQPHNPPTSVHRVLSLFGLGEHDLFSVSGTSKKFLPKETTPVGIFFSSAIELATPITKRQLESIAQHASPEKKDAASKLVDRYPDLLEKRWSILDILDETAIDLPFEEYIDMLPALLPRQYSISSSALVNPEAVSLTIDVHESPALSGHGVFQGVTSTYLASRRPGDRISCFVRPTQIGFRLPSVETPLIMVAAGTGIAPMRAFLQERSAIAEAQGVDKLAPAVLYFGCRHHDKDYIYRDELAQWEKQGIVKVKAAFSKMDNGSRRYVPDLIMEDKEEVSKMFREGGKIFLCGSAARLGQSSADVCKKIWCERTGKSEEEAEDWLQSVKTDRYVSDVY
ncbi:putative Flavoprotein-like superfamily [Septoria linicola]|nr:putative Flavoprotein-like superfamily [Septoria linicola]